MRINGFEQIKGFYSWVFNNQELGIKPQHCSLYVFLINQNNRNNWVEWFKCPLDLAMAGSCITSKKTYYQCLKDLTQWNLIEYTQGVNNWKAPVIKIKPLKDGLNVPVSEVVEVSHSTSINTTSVTSTAPQVVPNHTPLPTPLPIPLPTPNIKHVTSNYKHVTTTTETEEKNDVVDDGRKVVLKSLETATDSKELPDHIQELCENLISNKFKFSNITDEILENNFITFYNKDKYLIRRKKSSKIKDVFYFATNGCKFHSLLDLAIYLSTDEVSINQIKTTTRLPDESITDWVLFFIEHIFTEGRGLNANDAKRNMKYCWKSFPGEEFKAKLHAPKYNT